jgi:hypothetical protein
VLAREFVEMALRPVRNEPSPTKVLATATVAVTEDARRVAEDTVLILMKVAGFAELVGVKMIGVPWIMIVLDAVRSVVETLGATILSVALRVETTAF